MRPFLSDINFLGDQPPKARVDNSDQYVWGTVRYHDGFREGRFTKYCHRYNFSALCHGQYEIPVENYRYHHHGNEIDDRD